MAFPKSTQELLDKYWAAETTPEEEAQLRAALQDDNKSVYAGYVEFLNAEASRSMSTQVSPPKQAIQIRLRRTLSIAAAVLVLITAGFFIQRSVISDLQRSTADSFEDPMQAYEETKQALLLVSQKLNTSKNIAGEQLAKTQPYIDLVK